jgi:hypothetical protein
VLCASIVAYCWMGCSGEKSVVLLDRHCWQVLQGRTAADVLPGLLSRCSCQVLPEELHGCSKKFHLEVSCSHLLVGSIGSVHKHGRQLAVALEHVGQRAASHSALWGAPVPRTSRHVRRAQHTINPGKHTTLHRWHEGGSHNGNSIVCSTCSTEKRLLGVMQA